MAVPVTQQMGPCPCGFRIRHRNDRSRVVMQVVPGCGIVGTKLTKYGHLVGCLCHSCLGRRNRRKGQKGEARRHKRLGGVGWTPKDEMGNHYSINVTTQDKVGKQVPQSFRDFAGSEFARHAFDQAIKSVPVGSGAFASLYLELSPSKAYLVVDVSGRDLRA